MSKQVCSEICIYCRLRRECARAAAGRRPPGLRSRRCRSAARGARSALRAATRAHTTLVQAKETDVKKTQASQFVSPLSLQKHHEISGHANKQIKTSPHLFFNFSRAISVNFRFVVFLTLNSPDILDKYPKNKNLQQKYEF